MDIPVIIGFKQNIEELTKKEYELNPFRYKYLLLNLRGEYLKRKCMYMTRQNKPTNKGTKITWKGIETKEEFDKAYNKMVEDIESFRKEFGIDEQLGEHGTKSKS